MLPVTELMSHEVAWSCGGYGTILTPMQGTDPSPQSPANPRLCYRRYVLLHHVMGELEGRRGAWGYVAGGMGALSQAIAQAATARGAHIFAEKVQGVWERGAAWPFLQAAGMLLVKSCLLHVPRQCAVCCWAGMGRHRVSCCRTGQR